MTAMTVAGSVLRTSLAVGQTTVQIASNVSGVPLLNVAAAILNEIAQACDQVIINKVSILLGHCIQIKSQSEI